MYIITENLVLREAASSAVVEDVDIANKSLPEYIGSDDAIKRISKSHPEGSAAHPRFQFPAEIEGDSYGTRSTSCLSLITDTQ